MCTGVGAGKTTAGVIECLIMAAEINPGCPGLIVVPDYGTYTDVIVPEIQKWWPAELYEFTRSENRPAINVFTSRGVSRIYIRSSHNRQNVDKINGLTIAWAYMEEAGRFKFGHLAWRYTLQRLRYTAPYKGVFVAASPRPGWLPEAFYVGDGLPKEALQEGYSPRSDYYVRQARTEWNTHNPQDYAERMRAVFEGDFADQELDGAIVQATGRIYPEFARGLHVIPHDLALEMYARARRRIGGMDFGWSAPGAIVWGGWLPDGEFVVAGEWYRTKRQIEEQGAYAADNAPEVTRWYCDDAEPRTIEKLRRGFDYRGKSYSINARPAKEAKRAWRVSTDAVRNLMVRRSRVEHPNTRLPQGSGAPRLYISDTCKNLIHEYLHHYDANDPEDDGIPKDGDTVGDDHAIDALRYAIYTDTARGRIRSGNAVQ
jgi:phage terminase large subunit